MKNIINKIALSIIVSVCFLSTNLAQERNTVWIRGLSANSHGWIEMKTQMAFEGYDFIDKMFSDYAPAQGVAAAANQIDGFIGNATDVLGIAHDHGGIVLRQLELQNPQITGMILDGVPNQGSIGIHFATDNDIPGEPTTAQKIYLGVQSIKAGDNCNDCGFDDVFKSWIDEMSGPVAVPIFREIASGSSLIADLNSQTPGVPHAILYGTVDQFSLTSFMSSRSFPSGNDYFTKCYTEALYRARQKAKEDYIRATINNTLGFFAEVFNLTGSIISQGNPNPGAILSAVGSYLNAQRSNIVGQIQAVQQKDAELARILRCELANQVLAAEWELRLQANSASYTTAQVEVPCNGYGCEEFYDCVDDCKIDIAFGDKPLGYDCEGYCTQQLAGTTYTTTITVLTGGKNDGLLTQGEQMLSGAAKVYHLEETDHFQETFRTQQPVTQHLKELFDGSGGAAFVIPN